MVGTMKPESPTNDAIIAPRWVLISIGFLCLLLPALVWIYILSTPSDGARISKDPGPATNQGYYIDDFSTGNGLEQGDLVTGVDQISMAVWIENLFKPQNWGTRWSLSQSVPYQVVRNGETIEVLVKLSSQPVSAILAQNWSLWVYTILFQAIVIFVIITKPKEPAAQALFIWGMTTSHFYTWSSFFQIYDFINGYGFWLFNLINSFLWVSNWSAGVHLAFTFPTPLPAIRKRPWIVWMPYLVAYALYLFYLAASRLFIPNKVEWIGQWNRADSIVALLFFLTAVIFLIRQFMLHRKGPERPKMQWVVYSGLFSGGLTVLFYLLPEFLGLPSLGVNVIGIILLPFPISIAIAIWRHQLFDINLILNRTLVYGALTLTLAVIFFASVTLLQLLFSAITGQDSPIATVLSTLVIAGLFNPLRNRIQRDIDRRFFRRKYDAEQAIERFAAATRELTDLDQLSNELLAVVAENLEPESVSLWLKKHDEGGPIRD